MSSGAATHRNLEASRCLALSNARSWWEDAAMKAPKRRAGVALLSAAALLGAAIPVLAAPLSPSALPAGSVAAEKTAAPDASARPEKSPKPDKGPETAVSLEGTLQTAVDGHGRPVYTMTVGGKTWTISAGPPWYWGDDNPLAIFVGRSITVAGTTRAGDTELDVKSVDGKELRAPGKPPWAGGPWTVGPTHPGWKEWMADGKPGNGNGRASAPGQLKKASPAP